MEQGRLMAQAVCGLENTGTRGCCEFDKTKNPNGDYFRRGAVYGAALCRVPDTISPVPVPCAQNRIHEHNKVRTWYFSTRTMYLKYLKVPYNYSTGKVPLSILPYMYLTLL